MRIAGRERVQIQARAEARRGAPGSSANEVALAHDVDRLLVELERGDRLRRDLEGQVADLERVLSAR